jgi:hypothetical protein
MNTQRTDNGKELVLVEPGPLHKLATDVAGLCKEIVEATAVQIEGRNYVRVEGWQAIANGFGCVASARDVQKVYDEASGEFLGIKAIGEVKRIQDGMIIAGGEGFVGTDETRWFGGRQQVWDKQARKRVLKEFQPAPEYAARAMAQTRAVSRACRAAFAFVVVLINKELSTTPAEEVEPGDEPHGEVIPADRQRTGELPLSEDERDGWREIVCSYGTKGGPLRGRKLGELTEQNRKFLYGKFVAALNKEQAEKLSDADKAMVKGLKAWAAEAENEDQTR